MHEQGRLRHVWCAGAVQRHPAIVEDYANLARGRGAFETTGKFSGAGLVVGRGRRRASLGYGGGGYFVSADDTRDVIAPRASTIMPRRPVTAPWSRYSRAYTCIQAKRRTGLAPTPWCSSSPAIVRHLLSVPGLLSSAELLQRPIQVVIIGDRDDPAAAELRAAAFETPSPLLAILSLQPDSSLAETHPAFGKGLVNGRPAAYVCVGMTCSPPMVEPAELRRHFAAA